MNGKEIDKLISNLKSSISRVSMPWSNAQVHKDTLLGLVYLLDQMKWKYKQMDFPSDWDPISMYSRWFIDWMNLISDIILKYNEVVELSRNLNIKKWS